MAHLILPGSGRQLDSSLLYDEPHVFVQFVLLIVYQQIAVDSINAFEKSIEAYGKIADMLPRLDRLSHALADDHNFQNFFALVYFDIVEFHWRAYKFV